MSSPSGNFSGSCEHMCNKQTCVLRTSLSLYNFGRRFLGCSHYKVGPKCPFFVWVDNPTCPYGNEIAPLALERMSRLQSNLQLANERERTALETANVARQMAEEARQMAKKALEEEAKAKERERKTRAVYAKAKEKTMFAEEKQRMWKSACILSWIFFVIVMLLCFSSIEFSGVNRPRFLP